jgi:hypothetical protein
MGIPLLYPWANRLAGPRYEQGGRMVTLRAGAPGRAPGGARTADAVSALTHPGRCPLVEAYDAAFAVEVASTMGA